MASQALLLSHILQFILVYRLPIHDDQILTLQRHCPRLLSNRAHSSLFLRKMMWIPTRSHQRSRHPPTSWLGSKSAASTLAQCQILSSKIIAYHLPHLPPPLLLEAHNGHLQPHNLASSLLAVRIHWLLRAEK